MALSGRDLAILSARFGVARFGASRFGFYPDDVEGADNDEPAITVRPNLHRLRMGVFQEALRAEGHQSVPGPNGGPVRVVAAGYVPSRSQLFRQGMLWLQDEAESVVPLLLDVKPGMRVLDYCAAPGGKAAALAEAVAPNGLIVAMERHESRARSMRENSVRSSGCQDQ